MVGSAPGALPGPPGLRHRLPAISSSGWNGCLAPRLTPPPAACRHCRPQDSEPVTALALSPDGRLLFAASRSLQLRCWSVESGQVLRSYRGHKAPVADMVVDASGGLLATASADRSVRVWDVDGGFCTHAFTGHRWEHAVGRFWRGGGGGAVACRPPCHFASIPIFVACALLFPSCVLSHCYVAALHICCTRIAQKHGP